MDYIKIYNSIVNTRKITPYIGYTEKHHIIPRCLGGKDSEDNLVKLSAREHYICHLLLTKMFNHPGLLNAAVLMGAQTGATSRTYANLRIKFAEAQSIAQSGENNSQYGTKWIYSLELKQSKKIKITDPIPEGYLLGRVIDFDKLIKPKLREISKQKNIALYTELYRIYNELGWEQFILQTGYNKSKPNFVQMCSRHVEDYTPQNGKRRGK